MSFYDTQPMTEPAPVLAQTSPSSDPKLMMLARMLAQRGNESSQPGVLGGLDKIAKMALSGYGMSKMGKAPPTDGAPRFIPQNPASVVLPTPGTPASTLPGDPVTAFGSELSPYDPGMSQPGYGGFGSEMGGTMPDMMAQTPTPESSMPSPTPPGASGAKIICTELHRQGLMSDRVYAADQIFGEIMARTQPEVMRGYHRLASPVVELMRKSPIFSRAMAVIAAPWARHMAYLVGADSRGSVLGMLMMMAGLSVCRLAGKSTPVTAEA